MTRTNRERITFFWQSRGFEPGMEHFVLLGVLRIFWVFGSLAFFLGAAKNFQRKFLVFFFVVRVERSARFARRAPCRLFNAFFAFFPHLLIFFDLLSHDPEGFSPPFQNHVQELETT